VRSVPLYPAAPLLLIELGVETAGAVVNYCVRGSGQGAKVGTAKGHATLSRQLVQQQLLIARMATTMWTAKFSDNFMLKCRVQHFEGGLG
jgi:hypothetical protein